MTRQIRRNAFPMNAVGQLSAGSWRHPRAAIRYMNRHSWSELALPWTTACPCLNTPAAPCAASAAQRTRRPCAGGPADE